MKTKEEMIQILAKRRLQQKLHESVWADLITAVQGLSPTEKTSLMMAIIDKNSQEVGRILHNNLLENAMVRSVAEIESMLIDDTLSLEELSLLL